MLAITKNGTECSIQAIKEVAGENTGGAWCMVYRYIDDDCEDDYYDDFCIHTNDCPHEGVFDEYGGLTAEAERFVTEFIGSITEY